MGSPEPKMGRGKDPHASDSGPAKIDADNMKCSYDVLIYLNTTRHYRVISVHIICSCLQIKLLVFSSSSQRLVNKLLHKMASLLRKIVPSFFRKMASLLRSFVLS